MMVKIVYFAWVREKIGKGEEELDLPPRSRPLPTCSLISRRSAKSMTRR